MLKSIKLKHSEGDPQAVSVELSIFNKSFLTLAYKVLETADRRADIRFTNPTGNPAQLSLMLIVEPSSLHYIPSNNRTLSSDPRLIGMKYFASVYCRFQSTAIDSPAQVHSSGRPAFGTYAFNDENRERSLDIWYSTPLFMTKSLPVNAEFLIDYEDTLLPLKEECPIGTSKLLTNNYPGYICVDYQPIEKSIKDIRKLVQGM